MANNIFGYISSGEDFNSRLLTVEKLKTLMGTDRTILVFPPGLGGVATEVTGRGVRTSSVPKPSNIPFVLFSPYIQPQGSLHSLTGTGNPNRIIDELPAPVFTIALPIPVSALTSTTGVSYEDIDLGAVGGLLANHLMKDGIEPFITGAAVGGLAVAGITKALGLNQSISNITMGAAGGAFVGPAALTMGVINAGLAASSAVAQTDLSAMWQRAAGFQQNPFSEVLFKKVPFRTHRFDYTFFPKNEDESKTVDTLIKMFKFYMLPATSSLTVAGVGISKDTGAIFSFPYEFQITYSVQDTTFTLMPSVLESLTVNYGDQTDSPKFFVPTTNNKQYPAKIVLSMQFRETVIITREKIQATNDARDADIALTGSLKGTRYRF